MHRAAPELRTDRLRLRPNVRDDAGPLTALWQDPIVVRFFGGVPMPAEDCWHRLQRAVGHWALNGYGMWAVEELESGMFVGQAGLFEGRRGLGPGFDDAPEAGWAFMPAAHGKGYAREAMRAALRWTESELGVARTVCIIDPENLPSIRTAQALGYRQFGDCIYKEKPLLMFERPAASGSSPAAG